MSGDDDEAILALERSVRNGYSSYEYINNDPAFVNTSSDRRFKNITGRIQKQIETGLRPVSIE